MILYKLDIKNPIFFSGQTQRICAWKEAVHPAHNPRFNHDLQLEIDCIEWALKKIEVNKPVGTEQLIKRINTLVRS